MLSSLVAAQGASGHPGVWVGYATFAAQVNVLLTVVNALPLPGSGGSHVYRRVRPNKAG